MNERNRVDGRVEATESELYLPAGANPSFVTSRLEWLLATLFDHGVDTPR
jgi:hypothetical protein